MTHPEEILKSLFSDSIIETSFRTKSLVLGLYQKDCKEIIFGNIAMQQLTKSSSVDSLMHPTFSDLMAIEGEGLIFQGYLTIGLPGVLNSSVESNIFRRGDYLLILGDLDIPKLLDQNTKLSSLNQEVNNLQRELIKEKIMLQRAHDELNTLNKEKDYFMGMAAHDLRNPMGLVLSFVKLLSKGRKSYSDEKYDKFFSIVQERCEFSLNLLDDLLDINRISRGKGMLKLELVNYSDLVKECLIQQQPFIEQKGIHVEVKYESIYSMVPLDVTKMIQLLTNLISNATKYSYPNSKVIIEVSDYESSVKTVVQDFGLGIDSKFIKNLFEPFTTADNKATGGESSTGLGLAICKRIVENHNGKIGVESEKGKGSQFWFTIPAKRD